MAAVKIELDPGYGFIEFAVGDKTSKPIDLYAAIDRYYKLREKHTVASPDTASKVDWDALWAEWQDYLATFDVPLEGLSVAMMPKTVETILESIENLRKKDPQPAS